MKNKILFTTIFIITISALSAMEEKITNEQLHAVNNVPNDCIEPSPLSNTIIDDSLHDSKNIWYEQIKSVGGKLASGPPISLRRIVDGPANLRDKPGGKVINTFPHKFVVLIEAKKEDWYYIRGYSDRPCDGGWTYKTNLFLKL